MKTLKKKPLLSNFILIRAEVLQLVTKRSSHSKKTTKKTKKSTQKSVKKTNSVSKTKKLDNPNNNLLQVGIGLGILVFVLLIAAVLFALNITSSTTSSTQSDAEVIVNYDGKSYPITVEEVDEIFALANMDGQSMSRDELIDQLISLTLLTAEAERLGINVSSQEVEQQVQSQIATIEQQIDSEQLQVELDRRELSYDEFVDQLTESIRKDLLINRLLTQEIFSTIQTDEETLRQVYEENKAQFISPQTVSARHILICDENSLRCDAGLNRTQEDALALANQIRSDVAADTFAELANQYTEEPNSDGGNLGSFSQGQMVSEFEEVAFSLEIGEISQPVKTDFGYHIIYVYDKTPSQELSFEEVYDHLEEQYKYSVFEQLQDDYIQGLREQAEIEY